MSTHEHSRRVHELVDAIKDGYTPDRADAEFLRSFLPELPKQKTLAELTHDVYDAWGAAYGNDWADDVFGELETWLDELHKQLKGFAPAKPAHPEFLETEADYQNAPEGTIVASSGRFPWVKGAASGWACSGSTNSDFAMSKIGRRNVLRWGWGE